MNVIWWWALALCAVSFGIVWWVCRRVEPLKDDPSERKSVDIVDD